MKPHFPTWTSVHSARALYFLLFIFILLYAGLLRSWQLGEQSLWLDEAVSVTLARSIQNQGYPTLADGRFTTKSLPFHFLLAYVLSDNVHVSGRIIPVVCGLCSIIIIFQLCRDITQSNVSALIALALMAFLHYEIAWSRQVRYYTFLEMFILLSVWCIWRMCTEKELRYAWGAILSSIIAIFTHPSGCMLIVLWTMVLLVKMPYLLSIASQSKRNKMLAVLFAIAAIFAVYPVYFLVKDVGFNKNMNYVTPYLLFLWSEIGLLLPLAVIGGIAGSVLWPSRIIPLFVTMLCYTGVISVGWDYFAFRYVYPILGFLILFSIIPFAIVWKWAVYSSRGQRVVAIVLFVAMISASLALSNITVLPRARYILGRTAPQPEWCEAYDSIVKRELMLQEGTAAATPVTISAIPMFHDIYIGENIGRKYYLPLSYTGKYRDIDWNAKFSIATTVDLLEDLLSLKGYLVLDDFALNRLANKDIQTYLANLTPNVVIKREYNVYIWLLE